VYTGTSGSDNYTLQLDGSTANINVLLGGVLTYSAPKALASTLTFNLSAGAGSLTVNTINGNPITSSGITVTGGASADSLTISSPTGNYAVAVSGTQVTVNNAAINYGSLSSIAFTAGSGNDSLTQSAQPGNSANLSYTYGIGADSLNVTGGTFAVPSQSAVAGNLSLSVGGGSTSASVTLAGDAMGAFGVNSYSLANLTVNSNGLVTLNQAASLHDSDRTVLTTNALSISGGSLNLTANSMDVHYAGSGADPIGTIQGYLAGGEITSTLNSKQKAVGYADGADGVVKNLASGDLLLRFTLRGDTNLDGTINFTDLVTLSRNYGKTNMSWDQGEFTYGGTVNFTDLVRLSSNYGQSLN
jgi:hypothetical protein